MIESMLFSRAILHTLCCSPVILDNFFFLNDNRSLSNDPDVIDNSVEVRDQELAIKRDL